MAVGDLVDPAAEVGVEGLVAGWTGNGLNCIEWVG